ncbi:MAG: zinc carboxypeptidase, partial [Lutibacter sp.]|nr:zinc carboxypeptidase [Lutibacter sp.]
EDLKNLTNYTSEGGNIIAIGSALKNFADTDDFELKTKKNEEEQEDNTIPYNQRKGNNISKGITGCIFNSNVDTTHPLAYGYDKNYNSLKLSSTSYQLLKKGVNVAYFPENTNKVSGFAGSKALKNISNSLLYGVENKGRGKIFYLVDNPLFRSFWENGKLFFANALFLN